MQLYTFLLVLTHLLASVLGNTHDRHNDGHHEELLLIKIDITNMVFLRGKITSQSASKTVNELISLKAKKIYLYIDSPGGSVLDGLQIIQTMESMQQSGIKNYTIANNAASMVYIIHQYGF